MYVLTIVFNSKKFMEIIMKLIAIITYVGIKLTKNISSVSAQKLNASARIGSAREISERTNPYYLTVFLSVLISEIPCSNCSRQHYLIWIVDYFSLFNFFSYGVARFVGTFMMKKWKVNGTDFKTAVKVDSLEVPALLFGTPLERSFTCSTWGSTKLKVIDG